jgi:hypothetical protein
VAGWCEHENESSGSIKGGKFLDQVSDYQIPKKDARNGSDEGGGQSLLYTKQLRVLFRMTENCTKLRVMSHTSLMHKKSFSKGVRTAKRSYIHEMVLI